MLKAMFASFWSRYWTDNSLPGCKTERIQTSRHSMSLGLFYIIGNGKRSVVVATISYQQVHQSTGNKPELPRPFRRVHNAQGLNSLLRVECLSKLDHFLNITQYLEEVIWLIMLSVVVSLQILIGRFAQREIISVIDIKLIFHEEHKSINTLTLRLRAIRYTKLRMQTFTRIGSVSPELGPCNWVWLIFSIRPKSLLWLV